MVSTNELDDKMDELLAENMLNSTSRPTLSIARNPKIRAFLKLHHVYMNAHKKIRTGRNFLPNWWKTLNFTESMCISILFFSAENHTTPSSRWKRAKARAAKIGRGLAKTSGRAGLLAVEHWFEALDPQHRYGHNLRYYLVEWSRSQTIEPFFYWLDKGQGKEVSLEECPRETLQQQRIHYLSPTERRRYEVTAKDGKLIYVEGGELVETGSDPEAKWIFVLSTSKTLYVGEKKKGNFHHSSFLAGEATSAAGALVVQNGVVKIAKPNSGHYKPKNYNELIYYLKENNVENDVVSGI